MTTDVSYFSAGSLLRGCIECEDAIPPKGECLCGGGNACCCGSATIEFSRASCDLCGTTLAGRRHVAHAVIEGEIAHLEVCEECLFEQEGVS